MRLFWELSKRAFQRHLTYRAATLAGLATNFFFGVLRVAIFSALYSGREEVAGITLQGAITYAGLSQAVLAFLSVFSWYDLMDSIHGGDVASDLLKPLNLFSFWLAQDFGRAVINLITRGIIFMVLFELLFDLTHPQGVGWVTLTVSLILSWMVSFTWRFLVNLAAFWSPNARGFGRFAFVTSWFFSGLLMPLRFFPDWVVNLSYLTPFPHTVNTIVEVYLGILQGSELVNALLMQAVWAIGLAIIGHFVMRAGVRRLVILGG